MRVVDVHCLGSHSLETVVFEGAASDAHLIMVDRVPVLLRNCGMGVVRRCVETCGALPPHLFVSSTELDDCAEIVAIARKAARAERTAAITVWGDGAVLERLGAMFPMECGEGRGALRMSAVAPLSPPAPLHVVGLWGLSLVVLPPVERRSGVALYLEKYGGGGTSEVTRRLLATMLPRHFFSPSLCERWIRHPRPCVAFVHCTTENGGDGALALSQWMEEKRYEGRVFVARSNTPLALEFSPSIYDEGTVVTLTTEEEREAALVPNPNVENTTAMHNDSDDAELIHDMLKRHLTTSEEWRRLYPNMFLESDAAEAKVAYPNSRAQSHRAPRIQQRSVDGETERKEAAQPRRSASATSRVSTESRPRVPTVVLPPQEKATSTIPLISPKPSVEPQRPRKASTHRQVDRSPSVPAVAPRRLYVLSNEDLGMSPRLMMTQVFRHLEPLRHRASAICGIRPVGDVYLVFAGATSPTIRVLKSMDELPISGVAIVTQLGGCPLDPRRLPALLESALREAARHINTRDATVGVQEHTVGVGEVAEMEKCDET